MHIHLGSDHAGFELKESLKQALFEVGHALFDHGTESAASCDYPDFIHPMVEALTTESAPEALGIAICGSGNGVCMTANKHPAVRAALAWTPELAELARQHNNANVLCLPARFIDAATAKACVDVFLGTPFEGGRHARRVDKIAR